MSSILEAPHQPVSLRNEAAGSPRTLEDLLNDLGGIGPSRVRVVPSVGGANEESLLSPSGRYCELVDGTFAEKAMGFFETFLASVLVQFIQRWPEYDSFGFAVAEGALTKLGEGIVRIPGVSFYRWDRIGSRMVPRDPICRLTPNLAVEIVSRSNTRAEMERKRQEYFDAGVELVWIVYPTTQTAEVWSTPRDCHIAGIDDVLSGGNILPGFSLSMREWFQRADGPA